LLTLKKKINKQISIKLINNLIYGPLVDEDDIFNILHIGKSFNMMELRTILSLFILHWLTILTVAGDNKCHSECSGFNDKFDYKQKMSYVYEYSFVNSMAYNRTDNPTSSYFHFRSQFVLAVHAPCEMSIQFDSVELNEDWLSELNVKELQKHATAFSFDNGAIGSICPEPSEPIWVVNLKRGILSAIQNYNADNFIDDELQADVNGLCPTNYLRASDGIYIRKKMLNACKHRSTFFGQSKMVPYSVNSKAQNMPLFDGFQTCKQTIKNQIISDVDCEEVHEFRPSDDPSVGNILLNSHMKLKLLRTAEVKNVAKIPNSEPPVVKSLYFDPADFDTVELISSQADVHFSLKKLCDIGDQVIQQTPDLFSTLIHSLRRLDKKSLVEAVEQANMRHYCPQQTQLLYDALAACNTPACTVMMIELIKKPRTLESHRKALIDALAFVRRPTLESVSLLTSFISEAEPDDLLKISIFIQNYCLGDPFCQQHPELMKISDEMALNLGQNCQIHSDKKLHLLIATLRAFGNINAPLSALETRLNCLKQKELALEIRLAALQSVRRVVCLDSVLEILMQRYSDVEEHAEIRNSAFLLLMNCPSENIIQQVLQTLRNEQSLQVGSMVWSYLETLRYSESPSRELLHRLLMFESVKPKFDKDFYKFSHFHHISTFSKRENVGFDFEHAVLFAPDEYMPKQAFLNFTIHMYGQSMNLLEIGGRADGLDLFVEDLFGPNGYFSNPEGYYIMENKAIYKNPSIRTLHDQVHKQLNIKERADFSIYARVFGDEIMHYKTRDADILQDIRNNANVETLMNSIAKVHQLNFQRNVMFLEWKHVIPTATGLPVYFTVAGVANVNLTFSGKMSILGMFRNDGNLDINAHLRGGVAVQIFSSACMAVLKKRSGLAVKSLFHADRAVDLHGALTQAETFNFKLRLPNKEINLALLRSQLYAIENEIMHQVDGVDKLKSIVKTCSSERASKLFGFKICLTKNFPNSSHLTLSTLLIGPTLLRLSVENNHGISQEYETVVKWKFNKEQKHIMMQMLNSDFNIDIVYIPFKNLSMTAVSEKSEIEAACQFLYEANKKVFNFSVNVQNVNELSGLLLYQTAKRIDDDLNSIFDFCIMRNDKHLIRLYYNFTQHVKLRHRLIDIQELLLISDSFASTVAVPWREWTLKGHRIVNENTTSLELQAWDKQYEYDDGTTELKLSYNREQKADHEYRQLNSYLKLAQQPGKIFKIDATGRTTTDLTSIVVCRVENSRYGANLTAGKRQISFVGGLIKQPNDMNKYTFDGQLLSNLNSDVYNILVTYQNNLPRQFYAAMDINGGKMEKATYGFKFETDKSRLMRAIAELIVMHGRKSNKLLCTVSENEPKLYNIEAHSTTNEQPYFDVQAKLKMNHPGDDYHFDLDAKVSFLDKHHWLITKKFHKDKHNVEIVSALSNLSAPIYSWAIKSNLRKDRVLEIHGKLNSAVGMKVDLSLDGRIEGKADDLFSVLKVKNGDAHVLKAEIVVPRPVRKAFQQAKVHVLWHTSNDFDHILLDYIVTRGEVHKRSFTSRCKLGEDNYGLDMIYTDDEDKNYNISILKNERIVLNFDFGYVQYGGDFPLKNSKTFVAKMRTYDPLKKIDWKCTGKVEHSLDAQHFSFSAQNVINERNDIFLLSYQSENDLEKRSNRLLFKTFAMYNKKIFKLENRCDDDKNINKRICNGWMQWNVLASKEHHKHAVYDVQFSKYPMIFNCNVDLRLSDSDHIIFSSKIVSDDQKLDISSTVAAHEETLGNLQFVHKYSDEKIAVLELKMMLFNRSIQCQVSVGPSKDILKMNALIDQTEMYALEKNQKTMEDSSEVLEFDVWHSSSGVKLSWLKYFYKIESQKQKFHCLLSVKHDEIDYELHGKYDHKTLNGTVILKKHGDGPILAEGAIVPIDGSQYLVQLTGDAISAHVKMSIQRDERSQLFIMEVTDVDKPFLLEFDSHWQYNYVILKFIFERKHDAVSSSKYGFRLLGERRLENSSLFEMDVYLNELSALVSVLLEKSEEKKFELSTKLRTDDTLNGYTGLKVIYKADRHEIHTFAIYFVDPALSDHIYWKTDWQMIGHCPSLIFASCRIFFVSTMSYSTDESRLLTLAWNQTYMSDGEHTTISQLRLTHPYTKTDFQLSRKVSCVYDLPYRCFLNFEFILIRLANNNSQDVYSIGFDRHSLNSCQLKMKHNEASLLLHIEVVDNYLKLSILKDGLYRSVVTCGGAKEDRKFSCTVQNASTVLLHGSARLVDEDWLSLAAWHGGNSSSRVKDVELNSRVTADSMLTTVIYIRKLLKNDIQAIYTNVYADVSSLSKNWYCNLSDIVVNKMKLILDDQSVNLMPVLERWKKDVHRLTKLGYVNLPGFNKTFDYLSAIWADVCSTFSESHALFKEAFSTFNYMLQLTLENSKHGIDVIQRMITTAGQQAHKAGEQIKKWFDEFANSLRNHRAIEDVQSMIGSSMKNWKENIVGPVCSFWQKLLQDVDFNYDSAISTLKKIFDYEYLTETFYRFGSLNKLQPHSVTTKWIQSAAEMWAGISERFKLFYNVNNWVEFIRQNTVNVFYRWLPKFDNGETQSGDYIHYTLIVPFWSVLQSLENVFQLFIPEKLFNFGSNIATAIMDIPTTVEDMWFAVFGRSPDGHLLTTEYPTSVAVLLGHSDIITFDMQVFNFIGSCSYLLARDFAKGRFNVWLSHIMQDGILQRRSISIQYINNFVEINFNDRVGVLVNSKEVHFPWIKKSEFGNLELMVSRPSNHLVRVDTADGIVLECCMHYKICALALPKWYHGKSAGLFGINDLEPQNDFMRPNRTMSNEIEEFAHYWTISMDCPTVLTVSKPYYGPQAKSLHMKCAALFQARITSPLRRCFHYVDPTPYMTLCLAEVDKHAEMNPHFSDNMIAPCNTSAAYLMVCRMYGILLQMPKECLTCEVWSTTLAIGEQLKVIHQQSNVDVAFVIEEHSCMEDYTEMVRNIIIQMVKLLSGKFSNHSGTVRYSVFGFGGERGEHMLHRHMLHHFKYLTHSKLIEMINMMEFDAANTDGRADLLEILHQVLSENPFRPVSQKVIVLLSCEAEQKTKNRFYDIRSEFLEKQIYFHFITTNDIPLRIISRKKILGVSPTMLFAEDGKVETELKHHMLHLYEPCSILAMQTNGTTFALLPNREKEIATIVVQYISAVAEQSLCQICTCHARHMFSDTVCFPCNLPTYILNYKLVLFGEFTSWLVHQCMQFLLLKGELMSVNKLFSVRDDKHITEVTDLAEQRCYWRFNCEEVFHRFFRSSNRSTLNFFSSAKDSCNSITTFNMQYPPTISRTCQKFALLSLSDDPVTCDIKTDQESLSLPNWEEEDELLLWKCIALHKPESAALLTVSIEDECRSPSARKTKANVSKNQFTSILSNSKTECADLTQLTFRSSLTSRRFPIMGKGGLRRLQNSKLFTKSKATMRKATAAETENKPASMEK
ncbi:Vitellogenin, partial [Trichinella pseudospiralis]